MYRTLKRLLYFPCAWYFRIWAQLYLNKWKPTIIVVTGSTGKTTTTELLRAALGTKARFTLRGNSAYGVCFEILGLRRKTLLTQEWISLVFKAPLAVLSPLPTERIFVVEADCDRPGEGRFLASLLRPDYTILLNTSHTHTAHFDDSVQSRGFSNVTEAIAYEFGYFLTYTQKEAWIGSDVLEDAIHGTSVPIHRMSKPTPSGYSINLKGTTFTVNAIPLHFPYLLPLEIHQTLEMIVSVLHAVDLPINFDAFEMPPGRSSIFKGIKQTTIIDSSYNATPASMKAMLNLIGKLPTKKKWLVLGDMVELGEEEAEDHKALAQHIRDASPDHVVLIGPRVSRHTYPELHHSSLSVIAMETPKEGLIYLKEHLNGGETILFKGARFLEGVIEHLLLDPKDKAKLCRREEAWVKRRKNWEL